MKDHIPTELERVVIRFSGDSGDGMQLTGTQFAENSAIIGNDVVTFPDYPAEIRAPQGTVAGVSSFQLQIGKTHIFTPGDQCDILVAMNPAALKGNLQWAKPGSIIIVDSDSFDAQGLKKAQYGKNPLDGDPELEKFKIIPVPITSLTKNSLEKLGLDFKSMIRCKNVFALGMVCWLYSRPLTPTIKTLEIKFKKNPLLFEANKLALESGFNYAESVELTGSSYIVNPAPISKGRYRFISGNKALAWGFLAASQKTKTNLFLGTYPITPATDILHELTHDKSLGTIVFQAEDEISGVTSAIGASFAGKIAITTTSGPGLSLKSEGIGLAVITELPLVIVNVQRGGPSTGLPTKTEQSDLLQALYGRHGECPLVVLAASTPTDCFEFAYLAVKIAVEHMTPVLVLTDAFIANGSQLWKIPEVNELPEINMPIAKNNGNTHLPYERNPTTLARYWALPGTPGLEHRLGGLEKDYVTGCVSHDPLNHEKMVHVRNEKIKRVVDVFPDQQVYGDAQGDLLLVGWGGTFGALMTAIDEIKKNGKTVGLCHIRYMNPFPKNLETIFEKYKRIVVCELNLGQLAFVLRSKFQKFHFEQVNKVQGLPFMMQDILNGVESSSHSLS